MAVTSNTLHIIGDEKGKKVFDADMQMQSKFMDAYKTTGVEILFSRLSLMNLVPSVKRHGVCI